MEQSLAANPSAILKSFAAHKNKKYTLLFITAILLVVTFSEAFARQSRITWNPDPLAPESIAPGEEITYTVSLTNTGSFPIFSTKRLQVVAKGDAAKYISITQPEFKNKVFKRGETVTFDVTLSVPHEASVGITEGKLLLKRALRNRVLHVWRTKALRVEFTFSLIPLPPDPGEEGKITIAGIDSDNDGVRDDIQRWIVFNFPDQPAIRAGLRQYAIAQQKALIDADSEEMALSHSEEKARASRCLKAMVGLDEGYEYYTSLKVQTLNTNERSLAYIKYDRHLGGHVFHVPDVSLDMCDFDPSNI